jgi:hypothetical protein
MTARAIRSLLLSAILAGCGGGSILLVAGRFTVDGDELRITISDTVGLHGRAFAPQGATCTLSGGDLLRGIPPSCTCDVGAQAAGQWRNSATGGAGVLQLTILGNASCNAPDAVHWSTRVELASGSNPVMLFISDGVTEGRADITIVRN